MGVRFPSQATTTILASPASVSETVIATTPPLNLPLDFAQVFLVWMFKWTTNSVAPTVSYNLRRGTTIGGTLINVGTFVTELVSTNIIRSGFYIDTPGAVAGQQYSLTTNVTSGGGAGNSLDVSLAAFVL